MEKLEILHVSDPLSDGGSRECIVTNKGMFNLVNKISDFGGINGLYKDGKKMEKELLCEVVEALALHCEKPKLTILSELTKFTSFFKKL